MIFEELLSLVSSGSKGPRVRVDSRCVEKGDVFIAVRGTVVNGHDFIAQAIERGARYIVSEKKYDCESAEIITVENSGKVLGVLAQASFGDPSSKLTNLAVTGTNGKTTVGYLVRSVLQSAGKKCGLVGTVEYDTGQNVSGAFLTTPDALGIAGMAKEMVEANAKFMMIEASSHALSQHRLAGINFAAGAFTNLTGDHRDYHKTTENYLAAKTRLFEELNEGAIAILNKQSEFSKTIAQKTTAKILWYAVNEQAEITGCIESMDASSCIFRLEYQGCSEKVETCLIGEHNVSNHLAAAGLCIAAGFDLKAIAKGLSSLKAVPGRLEPIDCGQDFTVFVDYAHTDDALKNVSMTLRPVCKGKLIVLFGCGGDRDKTKRRRMAKVAEELADRVIVTSDNPRTEDPQQIIRDITAGFRDRDSEKISIEPDRKKAIELAIKAAQKNDIVLIAGKGHETYQVIGTERIDLDDRQIARETLRKI